MKEDEEEESAEQVHEEVVAVEEESPVRMYSFVSMTAAAENDCLCF